MNLGQAAAVCLYELVRNAESVTAGAKIALSGQHTPCPRAQPKQDSCCQPATAAQLELITALLTDVMRATEYSRRHAHNFDPAHIRRLVRRIGADSIDAPVWIGILKQILWRLSLPPKD